MWRAGERGSDEKSEDEEDASHHERCDRPAPFRPIICRIPPIILDHFLHESGNLELAAGAVLSHPSNHFLDELRPLLSNE